jgi:EmrB/QacA subfamily drug resistance transporter
MPPESPPAAVPAPMSKAQRGTLVATSLGLFMIFLDALIVNVALPAIQADFHVGEQGLQWVVAAYSLGMAVAMMSAATVADLYGRRRLYLASIAVFTAASAACALAPTLTALTVARTIQGVAAAATSVTSLALVSAAFPDPAQKARAIGLWTGIAATATAIGPTLGGVLVEAAGWRSIFLVNLPVGIVVVALSWRAVAESRDEAPRRLDVAGQLLFIAGVGAFTYAVIEGPRAGWTSATILALLAVAAVALAAFVRVETRSADPMMDLALFRDRTYTLAIGTMFVAFFAVYGMLLVTTQYLQNVRGHSPAMTGALILPFSIACTLVSMRVGAVVGRIGTRIPILFGIAMMIAGFTTLMVGMSGHVALIAFGLGLAGVGGASCQTPITTLAMSAVPRERAGMASGIMSSQRAIGSATGFAVLGSILAAWLGATLDADLARAIPDRAARGEVARSIVAEANPRAYAAEIGPGRPIRHADPATRAAIVAAADADFVQGIRVALGAAVALLVVALGAAYAGFPRGGGGIADARAEAAKIAAEDAGRRVS